MIDLDQLIEQANALAPLPASAVRLAELVGDPECPLEDVVELIAFDQALTLKMLRAANSAASAAAMPVSTVRDSVIRMGTAQVLALAIAAGARPFLQPRIPAYGLGEGALWRHSVAAAVATEAMQGLGEFPVPPEAFTAALLHDVGKLVLGRFLTPDILGFIRRAQEVDHLGQLDAESLLLEANHAELGGLIAQHWKLPPRIVLGITYHHQPQEGRDAVCDLTCVADQYAKYIEASLEGRMAEIALAPDLAERLALSPAAAQRLGPLALARYAQVRSRYNAI
jgi:HD-like signal output (HDOD) protein